MDLNSFFGGDSVAVKVILSSLLGSLLGWERFVHGRPAGLRTHLLVCLASTLMMEISYSAAKDYLMAGNAIGRMVDPTRIAAGVITGIGFLGAGVIIRSRETIQGLTSAACIWMSAVLGLAIGAGLYWQSIVVSVTTHLALIFLKEMENRLARDIYRMVSIEARDVENLFDRIKQQAVEASVEIISDGFQRAKQDNSIKIELMVKVKDEKLVKDYCNSIYTLEPVWRVSLERPY